jgi:hypothetical protein
MLISSRLFLFFNVAEGTTRARTTRRRLSVSQSRHVLAPSFLRSALRAVCAASSARRTGRGLGNQQPWAHDDRGAATGARALSRRWPEDTLSRSAGGPPQRLWALSARRPTTPPSDVTTPCRRPFARGAAMLPSRLLARLLGPAAGRYFDASRLWQCLCPNCEPSINIDERE